MKVPLFVELCAGTAALSLRLHRSGARPPVSRMGNKAGYADAILEVLGLRPGSGAERYLWCEPDPGCRLLLSAYTDADVMREAAAVLRSWKDEDPRALWERCAGAPGLAAWLVQAWWSYRQAQPESGWCCVNVPFGDAVSSAGSRPSTLLIAERLDGWPEVPASLAPAAIDPPSIPPGTICYIDPPYVGTTGYGQDLPRSEVERLALAWAAAGASVVISEAAPIELAGWHHVEITDARKGQKRTFSRQQREWLTMNREPAWRPGVQPSLF